MPVDEISVNEMTVVIITADEMPLDKISGHEMPI
jgi:hypothetical protein